jgi:hypothetical protein
VQFIADSGVGFGLGDLIEPKPSPVQECPFEFVRIVVAYS